MKTVRSYTSLLCLLLLVAPWSFAQDTNSKTSSDAPRLEGSNPHWYSTFTRPYEPKIVPPVGLSNSRRLDLLVRAGNLYLSLQDAIALALENNVDVEVQRYNFLLADVDLARTKAGQAARGVSTAVVAGPAGGTAASAGVTGGVTSAGGPAIPNLDPVFTSNLQWAHVTTPSQNTVTTGTTAVVNQNATRNFGITQGFMTGTTTSLAFNNLQQSSNAYLNLFNPATTSNLDLQVTQHLIQGFGKGINTRGIRVANNNLRLTSLVFQQQLINTVSNVIQQYWNLVSYGLDVAAKKRALEYAQKLYEDNKKQVEIGTLAPIEIKRAEAEVASREQDLVNSQTLVLQQETTVKNLLSRTGIASPSIADVHLVPTDRIRIPDIEPIQPIQDLYAKAIESRPDVLQSRLQMENLKITLSGTRASMLPTIDLFGQLRDNALSGAVNTTPDPRTGIVPAHNGDPFFIGGYPNVLRQIFGRNFPTYAVGFQMNIPLRNRAAQADMATAQLNLRQSELQLQKQINAIRVDIQNGVIAVQQARARYQAALKTRELQEETLDAEQKKFALGTSTPFLVIQAQRDLANAQQSEVVALGLYGLAKVQFDQVTGQTLINNKIEIDEARKGTLSRAPSRIPDVP